MQVRAEAMLQLLGDHQGPGDAALQSTYAPRDPLAEYLQGRISTRQLRVLVEGLPTDSAFHRAHRDTDWQDSDWIARDTNSIMRVLLYTVQSALSKSAVPKPDLLPAPVVEPTEQDEADAEYLAQQRAEMAVVEAGWFVNN
ncbi:hypothetical protein [Curtobacterium sp. PhB137]|uniref:hypothetical protein n=1 Tax=Curtobacterium sp. PhB137 TaxID=2485182 RepID=UPI000F4FCDA6|nr:hypothetical protein [Curtobacterium sp. PhB137]